MESERRSCSLTSWVVEVKGICLKGHRSKNSPRFIGCSSLPDFARVLNPGESALPGGGGFPLQGHGLRSLSCPWFERDQEGLEV